MIIKLIKIMKACYPDNKKCMERIRDVIADVPYFNIREKAAVYVAAKKFCELYYKKNEVNNTDIKKFSVKIGKINEHSNVRARKDKLRTDMRKRRTEGQVFYICSVHSNPAADHKDLQGKIYVDRFWRSITDNDKRVAAYIRNHDTVTVQDVIKEPNYLITRPHCKHYMIPLDTEEVLGSSVNKIIKEHRGVRAPEHNINYRKKYYKLRKKIHTELGMYGEARRDEMLVKRQG